MTSRNDAVADALRVNADALRVNAADLLRYLQRRAGHEVPDVLGETMLVAWRRAGDMPIDPVQARMWLFGIARMSVVGHGRDASRRLRLAERLHGLMEPIVWPDDAVAMDVRRAIASLPEAREELALLLVATAERN